MSTNNNSINTNTFNNNNSNLTSIYSVHNITNSNRYFPIIVVGAGHAGCEASLASARLGIDTLLLTINLSTVAWMPCNPSIGGPGKGHLVRELGVLGAEMPKCIDDTNIQIKWLNISKGPAVRAKRAQADKQAYRQKMTQTLFSIPKLTIKQAMVTEVLVKNNKVIGIKTETGLEYFCEKLILATGTFLNSRIIIGPNSWYAGPHNQRSSQLLSKSLEKIGIPLRRLQTATPPRIKKSSVNFSLLEKLPGNPDAGGFLWENRNRIYENQEPCWLTFTTEKTIETVKKHLHMSPLVLANITNTGPKHCPSIDRKVLKFPDQVKHQIFVEPEGRESDEMYLQGLTTSMPPESQLEIIHTIPGLENAEILRYGYAIEYDALETGCFYKTMASKFIEGLYTAGQINGTSGYEEAAAQGFVAGVNAAFALLNKEPWIPSRTESYIGVLIDDLSTWQHLEPYRITPANAEFRLHLRENSAEARLINDALQLGIISKSRFSEINSWLSKINTEIISLENIKISPTQELLSKLKSIDSGGLKKQVSLAEILQRPQINYSDLVYIAQGAFTPLLTAKDEIEYLETEIKYKGYANRDLNKRIECKILEKIKLPIKIDNSPIFKLLQPHTINLITTSNQYEDLLQLLKNSNINKSEIAIILNLLKEHYSELSKL